MPFAIKWPNDVYYNKVNKVGGILVKSSIMGDEIFLKIGVGLNVSNQHPTVCLNRVMTEHSLPEWTIEEFIARFANQFESLLPKLTHASSLNDFLAEVQHNWLHK